MVRPASNSSFVGVPSEPSVGDHLLFESSARAIDVDRAQFLSCSFNSTVIPVFGINSTAAPGFTLTLPGMYYLVSPDPAECMVGLKAQMNVVDGVFRVTDAPSASRTAIESTTTVAGATTTITTPTTTAATSITEASGDAALSQESAAYIQEIMNKGKSLWALLPISLVGTVASLVPLLRNFDRGPQNGAFC
ncbi:hypothetical protein HDU83_000826 [Entophlyctis luteolus]|nr:hypothetical protein HDU83_000826 [Entophlyctis luteolus]KAJ3389097.1 hypothetical protein HDU84_009193 [Entophlyctis sp. JEL0112]